MKSISRSLLACSVMLTLVTGAFAQVNRAYVDENGGGRWVSPNFAPIIPWTLAPDPTAGLLGWDVLTYTLPFAGVQGDVLITNPLFDGNPIHDVIRFDGNFHMIFYSDSVDGYHSLADTPGPPDPFYVNNVTISEMGPLHFRWADYTPAMGEPGWSPSNPTYQFISDGVVPEPSAAWLFVGALGLLTMLRNRCSVHNRRDGKSLIAN